MLVNHIHYLVVYVMTSCEIAGSSQLCVCLLKVNLSNFRFIFKYFVCLVVFKVQMGIQSSFLLWIVNFKVSFVNDKVFS